MQNSIRTNTVIIQGGMLLPHDIEVQRNTYLGGCLVINSEESAALDRKLRAAGWSFLFRATEIKSTVFGAAGARTLARAVKRLLAKVKSQQFNAVQIVNIATGSFLGVPYVTVWANSRNIQRSRPGPQ